MPKRMLIDASHPEETRVVVLDGQRVDEFDFESATKRPLKGNIYLAKVTRVEPSLQAAFVEYGGNRQGFLAFSEIHPDYYQIPVADRQALIAEQQEEARRRADDEFESVATGTAPATDEELEAEEQNGETASEALEADDSFPTGQTTETDTESGSDAEQTDTQQEELEEPDSSSDAPSMELLAEEEAEEGIVDQQTAADAAVEEAEAAHQEDADANAAGPASALVLQQSASDESQTISQDEGGSSAEAPSEQRPAQPLRSPRPPQRWVRRRHYKIQEVIKRKQVMLVQVVKEERGTKGAALTTYLSLAGRYCVLMPNTPRGGGISRKITNAADRNRLKSAAATLELPEGTGLIIRTAGANRTKLEIKRDYEYLLRMWDQIRELTLKSNAPACVYEEGDIIKRAIRDLYNKDVSEIVVEGEEGYKNAKEFMRMLMPSHAKNVKQYRDPLPIFQKHHIEPQLDAMFQPTVTLRSGGYIVINQTEALVSIDVNSGRATREHSIEETAHKTNLEAADEIGRQLRLRDLAGLIVIDFIDMEDSRNDRDVEKRLRDAVKHDRARVQIGKISQFGLLEMSRQRLRAGVVASSTIPCPNCGGQGIIRSVESTALRVLRALDEEGQRARAAAIHVRVANDVALYTLNQKRRELARIESDYGMTISFEPKSDLMAGTFDFERVAGRTQPLPKPVVSADAGFATPTDLSEPIEDAEEEAPEPQQKPSTSGSNGTQPQPAGSKKRRRRRRGRGSKPPTMQEPIPAVDAQPDQTQTGEIPAASPPAGTPAHADHNLPSNDSGAHATAQPQGTPGTSRRRRRRRRKPSSGAAAHPANSANSSAPSPADSMPMDHGGPAAGQPPAPEPNAPSEPVWSFASESSSASAAPVGEAYYRREDVREAVAEEPETSTTPLTGSTPDDAPSGAVAEAPQPQRKGWWQRTLKRS
jgi:ribonuclease E